MKFAVRVFVWFDDSFDILDNVKSGDQSDIQRSGITDQTENGFVDADRFVNGNSLAFQPGNKSIHLFRIWIGF